MAGTVTRQGGFLFRRTRPMPDGRRLMQNGGSFLVLEPGQLRRLQSLLIASVVIDLLCIAAIVGALVLTGQGVVSEAAQWTTMWIAGGVMVCALLVIGPYLVLTTVGGGQPAAEHGRLQDIWDQSSGSGG